MILHGDSRREFYLNQYSFFFYTSALEREAKILYFKLKMYGNLLKIVSDLYKGWS